MNIKNCLYCNIKYTAENGNSQYCSKEHYRRAKMKRQKNIDELIKNFRKGIYKNYKTFTKLMPQAGQKSFPLLTAKDMGFDEFAYYKSKKNDGGKEWHCVAEYYFQITNDKGNLILNLFK